MEIKHYKITKFNVVFNFFHHRRRRSYLMSKDESKKVLESEAKKFNGQIFW